MAEVNVLLEIDAGVMRNTVSLLEETDTESPLTISTSVGIDAGVTDLGISLEEPGHVTADSVVIHLNDVIKLTVDVGEIEGDSIDINTELITPIDCSIASIPHTSVSLGVSTSFTPPLISMGMVTYEPEITHTADLITILRSRVVGESTYLDTGLTSNEQVEVFNLYNVRDLIQDLHAVGRDIARLSSGSISAWQTAILDNLDNPETARRVIKNSIYQYAKSRPSTNKAKISR